MKQFWTIFKFELAGYFKNKIFIAKSTRQRKKICWLHCCQPCKNDAPKSKNIG